MNSRLESLADAYWDWVLHEQPTKFALFGIADCIPRIEDVSLGRQEDTVATLSRIKTDAQALASSELTKPETVTRDLLVAECDRHLLGAELNMYDWYWDHMRGPTHLWVDSADQYTLNDADQAEAALKRYSAMGAAIDGLIERLGMSLRKGATPPATVLRRTSSQIDNYLALDLADDPFRKPRLPANWAGESTWLAEAERQINNVIRPAFARYGEFLRTELAPVARADDEPGQSWLDGGQERYRRLARYYTTVELTPEEIHDIGQDEIRTTLAAEYAAIGEDAFGLSDPGAVLEHLRTSPDMRFESRDEIVDAAEVAVGRAKEAMGDWFGRLPRADCVVAKVPSHSEAEVPPAYYMQPAADGSRPGTYFINTFDPESKNRFDAEAIAYHEAIPGHHLQVAIAQELDAHPFQRRMFSFAYVEGWALYTERLADEMGLYTSAVQRLGLLSADSWRAGRLVVDTGIHYFGWTRQQAVDFLVENTAVSLTNIEVEVDRYIGWPGQALSYKIGQREIARLRADAQRRLGDSFDIKRFHDVVLGSGAVTLPILGRLVDDWIAEAL